MKRLSALLFLLLNTSLFAATNEPLHVLFVGNSYTSANNLPGLIAQLGKSVEGNRPLTITKNLRGGAWFVYRDSARAAFRRWDRPHRWDRRLGFRVCCAV